MPEVIDYLFLTNYLIKSYNYSATEAAGLMRHVRHMNPENKKALKNWMKGKGMKVRQVSGVTAADIYEKLGYNPVVSFLILDWLEKEPDMATMFLVTPQIRPVPLVSEEDKKRVKEKLEKCGIEIPQEDKEEADISDISCKDA